MSERTKEIVVSVSTNRIGSGTNETVEVPEEWDEMTTMEQHEFAIEIMFDLIEWDYVDARKFKPSVWNS